MQLPPPPVPVRSRPTWGIGDAAILWGVWFLAGTIVGVVGLLAAGYEGRGDPTDQQMVASTIWFVAAANGALFGVAALLAALKGARGLADFGLALRIRDASWLLVGAVFSVVANIVLVLPLQALRGEEESAQDVVRLFEETAGWKRVVFVVAVGLVAPVAEELLYRGVLLRALQRRFTVVQAVAASGLLFGLMHLLGDPSSYPTLAALVLLGVFSGVLAVRSGCLSRSIYLHAGFNLLTVVVIVTSG